MRVLIINVVCGIRSTGRICTDLAEVIEKKGYEVKIAYGRENVPLQYKNIAFKIGSIVDVYLHTMESRIFDNVGFGSRRASNRFVEWIRAYDPDIIHLHNLHGYYINIQILFDYLRTFKKKIIWTMHDCWAITGHCTHFDYIGCTKWKKGCMHCPSLQRYPKSYYDNSKQNYMKKKRIFEAVDNMVIVTPSEWLANIIGQSFLKKHKIKVINNGIDRQSFRPVSSNLREKYDIGDKLLILGVASVWDERKGIKEFDKLAESLGDDYKIVLIGKTNRNKGNKNILYIDRTDSQEELAEFYTAADLFVNPTLEDNFPTVNLEALSCGTPVITYNTGGSPEVINDYNGRVVEKENIKHLIISIREFASLKRNDKSISNTIRDMAAVYDKKKFVEEYMKLYES